MINVKLFEVMYGYENGDVKGGGMFLYRSNLGMIAIFKEGNLIWNDDRVTVSCKEILKGYWIHKEL
ncbi:TPA: hypothetical protein ACGXMW_001694 [Bacillus paranthracis]